MKMRGVDGEFPFRFYDYLDWMKIRGVDEVLT
jgi:hypothetical protein